MACFDLLNTTLGGVCLAPDGVSQRWMRRQGPYIRMAFARRRKHGRVGTGNGVACNAAQRVAGTGVKLQVQVVAPIASIVADGGNRVGNGQNGGDNYNQIHMEEVIDDNNEHPGFPLITGRLEQPVNRR